MIIGILGGIGSGKSEVTRYFIDCGHSTIDADQIGHQILELEEVREEIRARISGEVFDANTGQVDRSQLGSLVFNDREMLEELNQITHPRIQSKILKKIDQYRREPAAVENEQHLILDAALLDQWEPVMNSLDGLIFVDAPFELRQKRCSSRGWSEEELLRRERMQTPLESKKKLARWIVDNSKSLEETKKQIDFILEEIRKID